MRTFVTILFVVGAFFQAQAGSYKKFVEVEAGRFLYVDWLQAKTGKPTVVLLNGLTYETTSWDSFVDALSGYGYGILRYDPQGMGKTLHRDGAVKAAIPIENQARDLDLLTNKLGLTGPLNILGLSYGGGLAIAFAGLYPERVLTAMLMSPFTEPLASQDQWIKQEITATRLSFPMNPATDEELYDYFLRQNVYTIFPLSEPSILNSPLKPEAVFQMTEGIRKYDLKAASQKFPTRSVHLITADQDQYIEQDVFVSFWRQLPPDSRASQFKIAFSEHKIPEAYPTFAAGWIDHIMSGDARLFKGATFEGNPITGDVTRK